MSSKYRAVPLEVESIIYEKTQSNSSSITLECENAYDGDRKAHSPRAPTSSRSPRPLWILHAVLLTISTSLFVLSHINFTSTLAYVEKYNTFSPAASSVQYSNVKYNLSTAGNRFVGKGRAVDRAWSEISYDMGDQWLSSEDSAHLEIPKWHLQVNDPKTNETGYRVGVEAFHQLHCLNLLRKVTYREYYEQQGGELGKSREASRKHTDHCIEVLRHQLMCSADIGLFSLYLVDGDPEAWPELNTNHVCRDFSAIQDWAYANSVGNMEVDVVSSV